MKHSKWMALVIGNMLAVLVFAAGTMAHCIWVEAPHAVDPEIAFEILAFYADPDDPLDERDMTELYLSLVGPDGSRSAWELQQGSSYHYAAVNLPEAGQWLLELNRETNRYRLQEIRDFGKAVVWAGEAGTWVHEALGAALEIVVVGEAKQADGSLALTIVLHYRGEPLAGAEVEVFQSTAADPSLYEEIDEVAADSDGQMILIIDPQHRYVLETSHTVPARDVEDTGFLITEVRFRSTLFLGSR